MLTDNLENTELLDFINEYEQLAKKGNFDLLTPFIAEDAIYWFSDGTHVGIGAIRKAFEATWRTIRDEEYTITDVQWLISTDEAAVCIYNFHSNGTINGEQHRFNGRGTNVFKKINGNWKIVHEHLSKSH